MAEKDRLRTKEIRVKVTENELQIAKDKASYCNLTISDYIRKQITDGVVIRYQRFDIKELSYELNKIGININQIARNVNEKGGEYDKKDLEELKQEFENMRNSIYKIVYGIE